MDFLADEEAESFEIVWNQEVFEEGKVGLEESTFTLTRGIRKDSKWTFLNNEFKGEGETMLEKKSNSFSGEGQLKLSRQLIFFPAIALRI